MISIWFALLIPVVLTVITYMLYRKHVLVWELFIPLLIAIIAIGISKFTIEKVATDDVEYKTRLINSTIYYEPYTTWVSKTCSRTNCYGSGKSRYCTTTYYDCSYCDYNSAQYYVIDDKGNKHSITHEFYEKLCSKWGEKRFLELNRNIRYHGSCGDDGDAYVTDWNRDSCVAEVFNYTHHYENRIQAAHSAFKFPTITKEIADSLGLFDYTDIVAPSEGCYEYKQNHILGIDSIYTEKEVKWLSRQVQFLNSQKQDIKVWILVFVDKPIDISFKQEYYWEGGNDNDIVICIGMDKSKNLTWTRPFSWTKNKKELINIREDIMETKTFKPIEILDIIKTNSKEIKPRDFKDFNYLTVEPSMTAILIVYIIVLLVSIGCCVWVVKNDIN